MSTKISHIIKAINEAAEGEGKTQLKDTLRELISNETHIDLSYTNMGSKKMEIFVEALKDNDSIRELNLSDNEMGADGVRCLAKEALKDNDSIRVLNLSGNDIGADGVRCLAKEALKDNDSIRVLNLSGNDIGADGVRYLAKEALKSIRVLNLSDNNIGDKGAIALGAFKNYPNIRVLNLSNNNIGDKGAIALGAFKNYPNIREIDLSNNNIGDEGVKALGAFKNYPNIREIDLSKNDIGDKGAEALALNYNPNIRELNLSDNHIGDKGAIALGAFKNHPNIREIDLSNNNIGDEGAIALADTFECIPSIRKIDLSYNDIGDKGAIALARVLEDNPTIIIDLKINIHIGCEVKALIKKLLEENSKIASNLEKIARECFSPKLESLNAKMHLDGENKLNIEESMLILTRIVADILFKGYNREQKVAFGNSENIEEYVKEIEKQQLEEAYVDAELLRDILAKKTDGWAKRRFKTEPYTREYTERCVKKEVMGLQMIAAEAINSKLINNSYVNGTTTDIYLDNIAVTLEREEKGENGEYIDNKNGSKLIDKKIDEANNFPKFTKFENQVFYRRYSDCLPIDDENMEVEAIDVGDMEVENASATGAKETVSFVDQTFAKKAKTSKSPEASTARW